MIQRLTPRQTETEAGIVSDAEITRMLAAHAATIDLQARAIPVAVHRAAKARAASEGIALRAVIAEALRQYGAREWTPTARWTPEPKGD